MLEININISEVVPATRFPTMPAGKVAVVKT